MGEAVIPPSLEALLSDLSARLARLERKPPVDIFTIATRPAATAVRTGTIIFVSDAADGSRFQGSDGTNWKTLG